MGRGQVEDLTPRPYAVLAGIAASSAAVLIFEIVLTRVFAVTQFYHFAFVTVSLALLGFGASGSALTAFPALGRGGPRRWAVLALAQAVATLGGYAVANTLAFDSFSIAWDRGQIGYLVLDYVALAAPFFCGGAVVVVLLSAAGPATIPSHRVYAASLIGSGAGCVVALAGLDAVGGVGMVSAAALVAAIAALCFQLASGRPYLPFLAGALAVGALAAVWTARPPDVLELRLSPYKDLSSALRHSTAEILSSRWSASARIDHVRSEGIRSLPGLSFTFRGEPPPQDGLTFDGDDLSPIPLVGPERAEFAPYLLGSLPFVLRPGAEALVLEPRGGLDVLLALAGGARSVVAVESHAAAVEAAREAPDAVYDQPRVQVVVDEPRAYVERTAKSYDVIVLALTAPYRPVTSGAYSLAEDYRLTREAFAAYLERLEPGGILASMRWLQTPPSEEVRLIALAAQAARDAGADPARAVVALRGYSAALVLVKPDAFTERELDAVRAFAEARRFDLMAAPGLRREEANRFNVVPRDDYYALAASLVAAEPSSIYETYAFDVAPPTDDHPFFGHFFKWSQARDVLSALGKTWQPFGGAGYFVLLALLALAAAASILLVAAPLAVARLRRPAGRGSSSPDVRLRLWTLAYFGLLGVGFLFVEIPLIQRTILLVGEPTRALAVVLFALLVAVGVGSFLSPRLPWLASAVALTVAVAVYPLFLRELTDATLPAPLGARMVVGGTALVPLGLLMGTMFPKGLAHLERSRPVLVPWAWAVNGTASVIAAVGAALLALTAGFSLVLAVAAGCYGGCALLALSRSLPSAARRGPRRGSSR